MVITDHRGTHGLRDTLSVIGRFSFQRVGSSCGVYAVLWEEGKAEPFYFWGLVLSLVHLHPHGVTDQVLGSRRP